MLVSVARVLLTAAPHGARRVGGDESALLLPGTLEQEREVAVGAARVALLALGVTTTTGAAPVAGGSTAQPAVGRGRRRAAHAKSGGRDRVVVDGSLAAPTPPDASR